MPALDATGAQTPISEPPPSTRKEPTAARAEVSQVRADVRSLPAYWEAAILRMKVERGPAALDRFSDYHRHPGPQTRTAYPPRWTLRAHPSPELRRGLAGCCRTCQNFRNPHLWFKTRGTRTVQPKPVPSCSQSFLTGHCSATAALQLLRDPIDPRPFTAQTRVQIPPGTPFQ